MRVLTSTEDPGQVLGGASDFGGERWDDPIVKPAMVASGGQIVWDPNPPRRRGANGQDLEKKTPSKTAIWWIYSGFTHWKWWFHGILAWENQDQERKLQDFHKKTIRMIF